MKAGSWLFIGAALLVAVPIASNVRRDHLAMLQVEMPDGEPVPSLADYFFMVTRWRPTVDVRGDTVESWRWRIHNGKAPNRVEVRRGTILRDTTVLVEGRVVLRERFLMPIVPYDTVFYSYSVRAVDRLGVPSVEVFSSYLAVIGEPIVLPPPEIQLDTLLASEPLDSITVKMLTPMGFYWPTEPQPFQFLVGDKRQACALMWSGGLPHVAGNQLGHCRILQGTKVGAIRPRRQWYS